MGLGRCVYLTVIRVQRNAAQVVADVIAIAVPVLRYTQLIRVSRSSRISTWY